MMRGMYEQRYKLAGLVGFTLLAITVVFLLPPIPQDPAYHDFVDQRTLYGVPNFWNVASNLPFVIAGLLGLLLLNRQQTVDGGLPELYSAYQVFFVGVLLTGFGSAWYHLSPTNETLVWDRLPMTLAFMAFFSMVLGENLSPGLGKRLLWPLLLVGVLSMFLPMVLIPMILLMFRSRLSGAAFLWAMVGAYVVSKLAEYYDAGIYAATGSLSGHSVKHIIAAGGTLFIYYALRRRRPVGSDSR
jgi:hypothetical protein